MSSQFIRSFESAKQTNIDIDKRKTFNLYSVSHKYPSHTHVNFQTTQSFNHAFAIVLGRILSTFDFVGGFCLSHQKEGLLRVGLKLNIRLLPHFKKENACCSQSTFVLP